MALCKGNARHPFCTNPVLSDGMMCDRCWIEQQEAEQEERPEPESPGGIAGGVIDGTYDTPNG